MAHTFEFGVFDGKEDIQQKIAKAITQTFPETIATGQILEVDELAYTYIILHLFDQVLRKVRKQESAKALWDELEKLYLGKSLPNKLFVLERFFSSKLDTSKDIEGNLDTFNKLVRDITNAGDKISNEYNTVVLLNAVPDTYRDVKAAIKYGRDTLTSDIVINYLRSREF